MLVHCTMCVLSEETVNSTLGSKMSLEAMTCGYNVLHGPDDSGFSPRQNDTNIAAKLTSWSKKMQKQPVNFSTATQCNNLRNQTSMIQQLGWGKRQDLTLCVVTALHGIQTRSSDGNSLCPFLRLSVWQTRDLWQNERMMCPDFCTIRKII